MTAARALHITPDHAHGVALAVQDASAPAGSASAAFAASSASASASAATAAREQRGRVRVRRHGSGGGEEEGEQEVVEARRHCARGSGLRRGEWRQGRGREKGESFYDRLLDARQHTDTPTR